VTGRRSISLFLFAATIWGCTQSETVFVDREPFNPPPDTVNGFLGYFDAANKQLTCASCHVSRSGQWKTTKHADAYNTLVNSGSAQPFCYGCHTVSNLGNTSPAPAGYNLTQTPVYWDVQCESCHGPGYEHVLVPDAGTAPLASIKGTTGSPAACGTCHSGSHQPFVEEWSVSRHNMMNEYPRGREDCISCHTGQGALDFFGVRTSYLEDDAPVGQHETITCVVCHDPHGSEFDNQLRFSLSSNDANLNLCIKCHNRGAEVDQDAGGTSGPHAPEGPLVLGADVGWFPPGFEPELDSIRGTHGSDRNDRLCATCHVDGYTATDGQTGDFVLNVTGHRFLAIPCVDSDTVPTLAQDCTTLTERTFRACTSAGCHGDESAARAAYTLANNRIDPLIATMDSLLALVPPSELDPNTGVFTTAKGSKFNNDLAKTIGSSTHNPFLIEGLLLASIQALNDEYGPFP
jgi:predicted CXXCH cytochrome family protein